MNLALNNFVVLIVLIYCQETYREFLKKKNQTDLSDTDLFEPKKLNNGFIIKYSQDDTATYANLISPNKIETFYTCNSIGSKKAIGGLCADFDNSFFFGHVSSNNIIGKLYTKSNIKNASDYYIYMDADLKNNYLLLGHVSFGNQQKIIYLMNVLSKHIEIFNINNLEQYDIKYIRLKQVNKFRVTIINVKTKKSFGINRKN